MSAINDEACLNAMAPALVERRSSPFTARPRVVALLLFVFSAFWCWLLTDWMVSFSLIHFPTQRTSYLVWFLLEIVATVFFVCGFIAFAKARLRWSRMVFGPVLLLVSATVQVAATLLYTSALPDPSEDRLIWVGRWVTPRITTCMWSACVVTVVSALILVGLGYASPRDGTLRDFKLVVQNWFRSLLVSPWSLAFGPIFLKDVRVAGRRVGTYWMRGMYVVALLGLISILYFSMRSQHGYYGASAAQLLEDMQQIAPALAIAICWFQYVLLLFLAAALSAPSVCDERRTRTLSALMTTPMNSAQIVFGKLFSRLTMLLILALISLPFLLGARIFGGLEAESVLAMTVVSVTSALFMASLGMLFSIWSRKTTAAAVMAIFAYLLIELGPVLLAVVLAMPGAPGGGPPEEIIVVSSPITLGAITMQIGGGGMGPALPVRLMWIVNSSINIVFTIITLFIASGALRRVMLADPAPASSKPRKVRVRRSKAKGSAGSPLTPLATVQAEDLPTDGTPPTEPTTEPAKADPADEVFIERDREVWDQPVLWREIRQPALGSRRNLIVAALAVLAASALLYTQTPPRDDVAYPIVTMIGMIIICFAAGVSTTSSVSGEKEASTWQVLLSTPLRPWEILGPKMLGAIRRHWFVAAALAVHFIIGIIFAGVHPFVIVHVGMIIVATATFLAGTGILFSMLFARPLAGVLLNLILAGSLWLGLPMLVGIVSEIAMGGGRQSEQYLGAAFAINPVFMSWAAIDAACQYGRHGRFDIEFPGGDLSWWEYTMLLTAVCIAGILAGIGALLLACRVFTARSGRSS